jgi:hypothetical protein
MMLRDTGGCLADRRLFAAGKKARSILISCFRKGYHVFFFDEFVISQFVFDDSE